MDFHTASGEGDETFDPAERKLCPDESCIGLIGDEGRCKVCGRPALDAAPGESPDLQAPGPEVSAAMDAAPDGPGETLDSRGGADDDFAERQLCPDGACIGVIGPDGRCRVCGLAGGPPESPAPN
jgi:hypothetical protein